MNWWDFDSKRNVDRELDELINKIQSQNSFSDISPGAKEARRKKAEKDKLYFARTYFPGHFRDSFSIHHEKWQKISEITGDPVLVIAFRGMGKSTFFDLADGAHAIVFNLRRYLLFGGYTEDKAINYSKSLLLEMLFNSRIKEDFGEFVLKAYGKKSFKDFEIHPKDKIGKAVKVKALSIGQDPRGLKSDEGYRPDWVRLDDIQEDQRAASKKWVKRKYKWIMAQLIPALQKNYSLVILATPLNPQCLAMNLKNGMGYSAPVQSFEFPAIIRGKAAWPEVWGLKALNKMKKTIGRLLFRQEYLLKPGRDEEAVFKKEDLDSSCFELAELKQIKFEAVVFALDPTPKNRDSKAGTRCYKSLIGLGLSQGHYYIVFCWIKKKSVQTMVDTMYDAYDSWHPVEMGWEDNGGQALLENIFNNEAEKRGYYLPLKPITNTTNKILRCEQALSVSTENKQIKYCKDIGDTKVLIEQMEDFPEGFIDGVDTLAMAKVLIDKRMKQRRKRLPRSARRLESRELLSGRVF